MLPLDTDLSINLTEESVNKLWLLELKEETVKMFYSRWLTLMLKAVGRFDADVHC